MGAALPWFPSSRLGTPSAKLRFAILPRALTALASGEGRVRGTGGTDISVCAAQAKTPVPPAHPPPLSDFARDKAPPRPPMRISRVSSKGARRATPLAEPPMSAMIPDKVTRETMTISRMTPRRAPSTPRARSRHSTGRESHFGVRRLSKQSLHVSAHRPRHPPERYMNNCTLSAKERQGTGLSVPARRD